jgi:hypothetical protein
MALDQMGSSPDLRVALQVKGFGLFSEIGVVFTGSCRNLHVVIGGSALPQISTRSTQALTTPEMRERKPELRLDDSRDYYGF